VTAPKAVLTTVTSAVSYSTLPDDVVTAPKAILTTVTSAVSYSTLPDDGVTAPKHVGAVLLSILILFLRQFTCASVGE
jgi:hypothetical protein